MANSVQALLLCLSLFGATTLCGYLPSKVNASQKIMNLIAIFGAGLLVGAALIVIIPEGILTLLSSYEESLSNAEKS